MPLTDKQLIEILSNKTGLYTKKNVLSKDILNWIKGEGFTPPPFFGSRQAKTRNRPSRHYKAMLSMYYRIVLEESFRAGITAVYENICNVTVYETDTVVQRRGFSDYTVETPFDSTLSYHIKIKLPSIPYEAKKDRALVIPLPRYYGDWVPMIKAMGHPKYFYAYKKGLRKNKLLNMRKVLNIEKALKKKNT